MSNISVEYYNKTHISIKIGLESVMKTSLQQIIVSDIHIHKSKSNNLRIEEALTEAETMEKVRAMDEKRNKKKATKRNIDNADDANIPSKQ